MKPPYLGPEGGRPSRSGRPIQAVRHTCSGNLGIFKMLRILGQTCTLRLQQTRRCPPLANEALCLSTPKHNGKSGTETTYVSSVFESHSWRGVLDRTLCDQVCQ